MLLQPLQPDDSEPGPEAALIKSFQSNGKNKFFKYLDEEIQISRRKENCKKSTQSEFYERWMNGDPDIGLLGEDNGKFVYLIDYSTGRLKPQPPKVQDQSPTPQLSPHKKDPDSQQWLAKPLKQPCYKRINKWVQKHNQFQSCAQKEKIIAPEQIIPEVYILLKVGSECHFDYGITRIPDRVWPSTKGDMESDETLPYVSKPAAAPLHMPSRISSIRLCKK
ncbi:hypothetical protein Goari_012877 [Gossypium aridum]|uniref:Uncharacterized protein n=1 Tax=Gossypium aridum TaxID=34290 RepID=A0A7J8XD59_GOSAI|nr:hypothetical protein [Gossypium aridum]